MSVMMNAFKDRLVEELEKRVKAGVRELTFEIISKSVVNGGNQPVEIIRFGDGNIMADMQIRLLYDDFCNGYDVEEIVESFRVKLNEGRADVAIIQKYLSNLDAEVIEQNIYPAICLEEANREYLKSVIYRSLDAGLVVTLRINVEACGGTIPITTDMVKTYGLDVEQLWQQAFKHLREKVELVYYKPRNDTMNATSLRHLSEEDMVNYIRIIENEGALSLRCGDWRYGAAVVALSDVMDKIAKLMQGEKFIILPFSIEEVVITQDKEEQGYYAYLKSVLRRANMWQSPKEYLADCIYRYTFNKGLERL